MKDRDWRTVAASDIVDMLPHLRVAYWRRRTEIGRRLIDLAYRRRTEFMKARMLAAAFGMRRAALPSKTMPWWYGRLTPW